MPTSIELNAAMMAEVHTLEQLEAQRASYDKYTPAEEVAIIDAAIAQKKDGRGGRRAGAGRKAGSKDGTPRTRKSIGTYSLQMKISDDLKAKLTELAEERGVPMPTIAREILEAYFN
jgi:hypothetical protein